MKDSGAAAVGDGSRGELSLKKIRERILAKGFTEDQFSEAIDEYALLDVSIPSSSSLYIRTDSLCLGVANSRKRYPACVY